MRIASLLCFGIAGVALAVGGAVYALPELAAVGLALGGLSVAVFLFGGAGLVHALLALHGIAVALFGLFHMPPLLCAGVLAVALVGWDAALTAPQVSRASQKDRRRFAVGYALRSAALAGAGVVLVAVAGTIRVSLTFGSGFGLSFIVLVLAALFLRSLQRARASEGGDERPGRK